MPYGSWHRCSIPFALAMIAAACVGAAEAIIWHEGFMPFVRPMIPFAILLAILILTVASLLAVKISFGGRNPYCREESRLFHGYSLSLGTLLFSSAVQIVFGLTVLSTCLPYAAKTVLAFAGSFSFWMMLLTFLETILCVIRRR